MFRIRAFKSGWVVEKGHKSMLIFDVWQPYLTYRGTNELFVFESIKSATDALNHEIRINKYQDIY